MQIYIYRPYQKSHALWGSPRARLRNRPAIITWQVKPAATRYLLGVNLVDSCPFITYFNLFLISLSLPSFGDGHFSVFCYLTIPQSKWFNLATLEEYNRYLTKFASHQRQARKAMDGKNSKPCFAASSCCPWLVIQGQMVRGTPIPPRTLNGPQNEQILYRLCQDLLMILVGGKGVQVSQTFGKHQSWWERTTSPTLSRPAKPWYLLPPGVNICQRSLFKIDGNSPPKKTLCISLSCFVH